MLLWALSFHDMIFLKVNNSSSNYNFRKPFWVTKEFIRLYIACLSEKVKSISQFLFLIFFNAQCIIYDTFSSLNFGEL